MTLIKYKNELDSDGYILGFQTRTTTGILSAVLINLSFVTLHAKCVCCCVLYVYECCIICHSNFAFNSGVSLNLNNLLFLKKIMLIAEHVGTIKALCTIYLVLGPLFV